jgi:hypothetical protein
VSSFFPKTIRDHFFGEFETCLNVVKRTHEIERAPGGNAIVDAGGGIQFQSKPIASLFLEKKTVFYGGIAGSTYWIAAEGRTIVFIQSR